MSFSGFSEQDFDCMTVPGLEPRMEAIIDQVRPKLTSLGNMVSPYLSALCGEEMYPHVAKHARRKVNPPNDTWIAWASNKRGYKALPHFQVGMFSTHLFIIFAVIYESPNKVVFADYLEKHTAKVKKLVPDGFYWSTDHMDPSGTLHKDCDNESLKTLADRLKTVKKSEIMCGLRLERDNAILRDGDQLLTTIEETFTTLLPLYKGSF
ncbi:DUF1054 domain-containing protein [Paenibacillus anaericanus]|uniref:UPF0637 protein EJP82_05725 n=1 Tax=Paenibacillus anaericanus TaxID=170367 RepID=A0A433YDE6_9BACL|nr:DUF1054 domain-containing protein [Paenibacillus anaericanus]RUT47877.1 DUF1054 domain-containing protein [Paenibacillus anaericanus]